MLHTLMCLAGRYGLTTFSFSFFRSHGYNCLDARFYDDEMLTVVLQGAEENNSKRILAQLPLTSALTCEAPFNWKTNLRCVCVELKLKFN